MTRTEQIAKAIGNELTRRKLELEQADKLRSVALTVYFDKRGVVCAVGYSREDKLRVVRTC